MSSAHRGTATGVTEAALLGDRRFRPHRHECQLDGIFSQKSLCGLFFCHAALLAIKQIESPFTNDLRQFQEIASSAPLAMVAVAIDYVSPELGCLCHYQIKFPLRQLIKLLKLNRSVKQVTFKPLWI